MVVSVVLLFCATAWMIGHWRSWRATGQQGLADDELKFRWRQFRRRMQTSAMLGLLAVAILVGPLLTGPPWLVLVFWIGVLLVVVWVMLLALVDIWATKFHFSRLRQAYLKQEAELQAEVRRVRAARGNGQARGKGRKKGRGKREEGERGKKEEEE